MASETDQNHLTLEICVCFILIAYISFYLGTQQNHNKSQYRNLSTSSGHQNHTRPPALNNQLTQGTEVSRNNYEDGFEDGSKTGLAFEIHELKRAMEKQRELEKKLEKLLRDHVEKEAAIKQSIDVFIRECRAERKGWLDEQYRVVWEEKRAKEKGVKGWFGFGFGSGKRERTADTDVDRGRRRRGSEGDVDWVSFEKEKW